MSSSMLGGRGLGLALGGLLVLSASLAAAAPRAPRGAYAIEGHSQELGPYRGWARIGGGAQGRSLTLSRAPGLALRGELVPNAKGFELRVPLEQEGLSGRLARLAGGAAGLVLEARYRLHPEGGFAGRWRVRRGGEVLDRGRERLLPAPTRGAVRVAVSVDWEGRDLEEANLAAMERFHAELPDVPLTHFLNAAYFTKMDADEAAVAAAVRRGLARGDELGLHVHAWRSLVQMARVPFRRGPTFWGADAPLHPAGSDEGHEVELCAYDPEEIRAIVAESKRLLHAAGFRVGRSFRAGGWMADGRVLEAIRAEGFLIDSSATDATWHDELAGVPLRRRIRDLWPDVTRRSHPSRVDTRAGIVIEMPDTGALADYVSADEMIHHLEDARARLAKQPERDVFVHIGFHQETAARYAGRVIAAIQAVRTHPDPDLLFETLTRSARAAWVHLREARPPRESLADAGLPAPRGSSTP